jgi:hypothetical protein
MQRINRSAHAPVGTIFFLFLGLTILPVSLRAAGVQVSFSPRLSAAADAWQQIADVFSASYVPAPTTELSVVKDLDVDPSTPIETCNGPRSELACLSNIERSSAVVRDVIRARALKPAPASHTRRTFDSIDEPAAKRAALTVAAEVIKASFEDHPQPLDAMRARKIENGTQGALLQDIRKQMFRRGFEPTPQIRNLPLPKELKVLVQIKRATAGLLPRAAQCKVYSALVSARRQECERARLTSNFPVSPDNGEL